jgi:hypothetical protein
MAGWELSNVAFVFFVVLSLAVSVACALYLSNETIAEPALRGRPPTTLSGIEKAIVRFQRLKNEFLLRWFTNTALVGRFGVVIPSALFFLACFKATSFSETSPFIFSADGSTFPRHPTDDQLVAYVWGQIQNSLTLGYFDTVRAPVSEILHDASNIRMFATVFVFRAVIDFFSVGWLFAGMFGALGRTRIQNRIEEYEGERMKLKQANPSLAAAERIEESGSDAPGDRQGVGGNSATA